MCKFQVYNTTTQLNMVVSVKPETPYLYSSTRFSINKEGSYILIEGFSYQIHINKSSSSSLPLHSHYMLCNKQNS